MSDSERDEMVAETTPANTATGGAPAAAGGPMDLQAALKEVLKISLIYDGLARGLHECAKALDKREAALAVLAENCDEPAYSKLVEALCSSHQIPLVKVKDRKALGEWVGLCKIDKEGKARKVVSCSCVVVRDFGKDSEAQEVIKSYIESQKR